MEHDTKHSRLEKSLLEIKQQWWRRVIHPP
jgi:hypothetical protein